MGAEVLFEPDEFDVKVLNALQYDFTVSERPYRDIAVKLNTSEEAVLERVRRLYATGVIRRLGASIDSRRVGYVSVLVALKVDKALVLPVAKVVNSFAGVTHNYLRDDEFNMWFTVIAPDQNALGHILATVTATPGVAAIMPLTAKRVFKVNVQFPLVRECGT